MDPFTYAKELNIRRFQNLLDTSVDETERQKYPNSARQGKSQGGASGD